MVLKSSIPSLASPCMVAVGLGFWNSDHVVLKLSIRSSALPRLAAVGLGCWNYEHVVLREGWLSESTSESMTMMKLGRVTGCRLALPCPAQQWHQCDSECIFVTLEIHLTTLFSEIFCFGDFFL